MVVHKDYQAPTFENDIAILELEDPIQRQPHVVPICMPRWASHKDVDDLYVLFPFSFIFHIFLTCCD